MLKLIVATLTLLLSSGPLAAQAAPVTVFVVRHAEKGTEPQDPSLTAQGRQRADALVETLRLAGVTALFASEFKRTQETVAPLASALSLTPAIVPAAAIDSLVARLRNLPAGSRAVVASHSNLVHLIVERLGGGKVTPLTEADYDRLAVVTLLGDGRASVVVLRYGAP